MGLKNDITNELSQAFNTDLKDVVKDFVVIRHTPNDDDWAINDNQGTQHSYTGRGVFSHFNAYEIDGQNVMVSDVKLICLQDELTDIPQIDDIIDDMRVLTITKDPADVSYILQLRRI